MLPGQRIQLDLLCVLDFKLFSSVFKQISIHNLRHLTDEMKIVFTLPASFLVHFFFR